MRTPITGSKTEPVTELNLDKEERTHRHAVVLPDGKAIMFTVAAGGMQSFDDAHVDVFTLDTRQRKTIIDGGFAARYAQGHIVYARGGNLYSLRTDGSWDSTRWMSAPAARRAHNCRLARSGHH